MFGPKLPTPPGVMAISGNRLAKYLVMVSQVVAWCTVSVMLLRKGLNQVHGVTQYSNNKETMVSNYGSTTNKTTTTMNVNHAKSFDDSGTPAVVAGIIMIAIAVIMLIISPTIMLMKIIEKKKKRIRNAVSSR